MTKASLQACGHLLVLRACLTSQGVHAVHGNRRLEGHIHDIIRPHSADLCVPGAVSAPLRGALTCWVGCRRTLTHAHAMLCSTQIHAHSVRQRQESGPRQPRQGANWLHIPCLTNHNRMLGHGMHTSWCRWLMGGCSTLVLPCACNAVHEALLHGMQVWENLTFMQSFRPVQGNLDGSYLTMFSSSGLIFGVIQVRTLPSVSLHCNVCHSGLLTEQLLSCVPPARWCQVRPARS